MSKLFKYLSFLSLGIIFLYLSPLFWSISDWDIEKVFPEVILDEDYQGSLVRTVTFSSISTFFVVFLSFFGGFFLRHLKNKRSLLLGSLLLLPFLLGSVSTSFLFKILLFDSGILNQAFNNSMILFSILGIIQFWQFGTLFTYLFWLNNLSIKPEVTDYANYYSFGGWERVKYIYLPFHRNLIILLSIFFFLSNIYESSKLQIIFRASKGTSSELISNTLYNAYLSDSKISPDFAGNILFAQSALFYLPVFIILTIVLYGIMNYVISFLSKSKFSLPLVKSHLKAPERTGSHVLLLVFAFSVIAPIVYAFFKQGVSIDDLSYLLSTIGLSFTASVILLIVLTLPVAYYLRIQWQHRFQALSRKNLWIFISLFLLFLIPPLVLMLFGFEWSNFLQVRGSLPTNTSWIIGQCISAFPIIASFILVIHFFTKNRELEYLGIMKADFAEIVRWSFLKRYRVEYAMTFLFAFSIIWNEGTFNKVYSDRIPSYVSEILRTVNSRNADYSQGMMFFLFSLLLGFACILLWNLIVARLVNINRNS